MFLLAPFTLQNFKKILRVDPELWGCAIFRPKMAYLSWTNFFFGTNHYYYFHLPTGPFHCAKFRKFLQRIQSYEDVPFLNPKWSSCCKQIFFWRIINIILIYLLAPFIGQNFKKILPADPEFWGCAIFGPKMAHFPKWEFFSKNLLMSLVSFIHAYLHAKNQSQILIY